MPDLSHRSVNGAAVSDEPNVPSRLQAPGAPLPARQQRKGDGEGAKHRHQAAVLAQGGHKEAEGEEGPPGHDEGLAVRPLKRARGGGAGTDEAEDEVAYAKAAV